MADGAITVRSEVQENLGFVRHTGGSSRSGNAMTRFAEMESLLENSERFNTGVADQMSAQQRVNPLTANIPNFINTGNISSNRMNFDNMTRQQLIE